MKFICVLITLHGAIQISLAIQKCEKDFFKTKYKDGSREQNVLLIWYPARAGTQNILRLCSNETGLPLKRHCAYDRLTNSSKWEDINRNISLISCDSIFRLCLGEPFIHNYIMKNNVLKRHENKWKTTQMMETGYLREPCLQSTGLSITRHCGYNSGLLKAQWEPLGENLNNISCLKEIRENIVTYNLSSLYDEVKKEESVNKVDATQIVNKISELLTLSNTTVVPADIKISSEILKIVTKNNSNPNLVTEVMNVTNIIMATDPLILRRSEEVNTTTTLLNTVDNYLQSMAKLLVPTDHCKNTSNGIVYKALERASVFYINPSCSNISGVAIFSSNRHRYDVHTNNYYRFLYLNQSLEQIISESELRLATYFPLSLWNKLKTETGGIDNQTVLTFIIFQNDLLFASQTIMNQRPARKILEISIPNYSGELPEDVPFIFTYSQRTMREKPVCGYWNYSTWISTGIKTHYVNNSGHNLLICHSTHLSHFAALVGISFKPSITLSDSVLLNIIHDKILDYISISGCGLSLFGLSCIWLTAICFQRWREQSSNKVLLNICLVLTLIMVFFLLLNLPELWNSYIDMKNFVHCMIIGIFLHYNVLVLFTWMLIIAIMQYQRYVTVLGYERPSKYITKFAFIAWGLPLIPTCLVAYLDPYTYMPSAERISSNTAICYPSGNSLYYGVILPMVVIMLANLAIFIYIFYSLHRSLNQFKHETKQIIMQVRISILLFFLLGISWIFGFLSHLDSSPVFSYLFCLTATLQGFVLFIYFVVIDESTRHSWVIFCCAKNYYTNEETSSTLMQK